MLNRPSACIDPSHFCPAAAAPDAWKEDRGLAENIAESVSAVGCLFGKECLCQGVLMPEVVENEQPMVSSDDRSPECTLRGARVQRRPAPIPPEHPHVPSSPENDRFRKLWVPNHLLASLWEKSKTRRPNGNGCRTIDLYPKAKTTTSTTTELSSIVLNMNNLADEINQIGEIASTFLKWKSEQEAQNKAKLEESRAAAANKGKQEKSKEHGKNKGKRERSRRRRKKSGRRGGRRRSESDSR